MRLPLSLQIALRFSQSRRRSGMISLISIISTIGIALGVKVLIIGLSVMNGFERELHNRILAVIPHGEIEPVNTLFSDWPSLLKRMEQVPGILASAPYVNFTGLVEHEDKLQAIRIKGVHHDLEMRLSALPRYIQNDAWFHFQAGQQQIIVGKGLADILKIKSGDWITVMIPNSDQQMNLLKPKLIRLQIRGILELNSQLDHNFAIVPLEDAQNYLQQGENVSGIAIKVSDIFKANQLVRDAGEVIHTSVKIRSWIGSYGYMYRDIKMIRAMMYLAMLLVIGVACFNIVSTLVMAVEDKSIDIAILCTLGAKNGLIRTIFIWYGFLTGLTGSVIGAAIGILIVLNMTILLEGLEHLLGHKLLSSNVYFINFLPTELHWQDVISVLATALLLTLLASWYPAQRARRIDPARALSYK
ncbi:MAG: lipoprotein-releasing ABC transporter permease subunit LolE [Sodalis sp. (in: enterobacteria)]